jgi:opacity protein-like surface antigen
MRPRSNSGRPRGSQESRMIQKIVVLIAVLLTATSALAQASRRAGHGEFYLGPVFTAPKNYTFDGGTKAHTDTGNGLNLGFAYNFDAHWQAGIDFAWSEIDYSADVRPGPGNSNLADRINGTIETGTVRFNGTWNMLAGNFTPFVTGGLGWTYIDTNIPAGRAESVCWYYPWYGSYCGTYVPTKSTTRFTYNAGLGLRLDVGKGVFRGIVNQQWADLGGYGQADWLQYRIDFGVKF